MVARGNPFFFAYLAKERRKWITKQGVLKKLIPHKWRNEIPLSNSPKWNIIWHKAKAQKEVALLWLSSIMQWWLMNDAVKSQWRFTKVALTAALSRWSWWSIGSTIAQFLNKGGNTQPTPYGSSLPQKEFWCT